MKLFHTADWHLGKLVQGVYMTDDQRYVLEQFVAAVKEEKPDAVIIAGDLYDRAIPPTEAVDLLDELLRRLIMECETTVLAIAGNHDSPDRLDFGTRLMESRGLHLAGRLRADLKPVVLHDEHGEVHVYLVPYADPAQVRLTLEDDSIRSHDDALRAIVARIEAEANPHARRVFVGHAFVTQGGEPQPNTSESERPLAIGGAEHVNAAHLRQFHYSALGHLHQAHHVGDERIRYAGSPLKYSSSEANHRKGWLVVEMDAAGAIQIEKRELAPLRDMRRVSASIEEIENEHARSDDYVFVTLLNDNPVLFPMEKVRAVYPNALHVERRPASSSVQIEDGADSASRTARQAADPVELFAAFYHEVKGMPLEADKRKLFEETFADVVKSEGGAV
ncbi:nuclease SbcCD, D subunit [Paenibacillus curdlanolyticus YK9]|uniref:Nuclease SbcCD subunit D n=1 Tax=Paenibacillus curdlanolyticus YK9 TaxID=717606 RepID=E0IBN2_9BACL|nr:exonuclease SbcCD subunit D [Paenibacillus curdlanolyticus]EFM10112.1 nuclease SbcCD, D subunit [Paenibacillus curdlanolyticus YK9]